MASGSPNDENEVAAHDAPPSKKPRAHYDSTDDDSIGKTIKLELANFDGRHLRAIIKEMYQMGVPLGLYGRLSSHEGHPLYDDPQDLDHEETNPADSPRPLSSAFARRRTKKSSSPPPSAEALKAQAIASHFGCGGVYVYSLLRALNNALIS